MIWRNSCGLARMCERKFGGNPLAGGPKLLQMFFRHTQIYLQKSTAGAMLIWLWKKYTIALNRVLSLLFYKLGLIHFPFRGNSTEYINACW